MDPKFANLDAAATHITTTEAPFALEEVDIRGERLTVFANAPRHIGELMSVCDEHGAADFLIFEEERYSYSDFQRNVQQLACALKNKYGVTKGHRVAICMRNYPEYLSTIMAIASLGGVVVFLNSWWTTQELRYGFSDSAAKLAFVDGSISDRMEPFADELGVTRILVRSDNHTHPSYDQLTSGIEVTSCVVDIDTDDDMAIMYTSGSTGHPKGVVQTHRGAISALMSWLLAGRVAELTGTTPAMPKNESGEDLQIGSLITTPLFHVSATHACFLLGLAAGAKLVMMKKWDAQDAVTLIERENVTRFFGVPTMSADLIDAAQEMGRTLDTVRSLDAGGAKRAASQVAELAQAFPHAEPRTGYGLTETNALGIGIGGDDYIDHPGSAGRLYPPLQQMRIVDDLGNEVPVGHVGELILKSAANMRAYLNKPEATAEAIRNGWLYTGDLATVDEDGFITIVDRKKDMIIRGGENISCLEVDDALHQHPAVAEAASFSIPHVRLGEVVGAAIQLRPNQKVTEPEIKDFLGLHLAVYKIPERIWFREALPRGGTEKTDRRALRLECLDESTNG